ncbi:MAG: hypothetical protein Q9222_002213 [Ikaeria aurantiellina]
MDRPFGPKRTYNGKRSFTLELDGQDADQVPKTERRPGRPRKSKDTELKKDAASENSRPHQSPTQASSTLSAAIHNVWTAAFDNKIALHRLVTESTQNMADLKNEQNVRNAALIEAVQMEDKIGNI